MRARLISRLGLLAVLAAGLGGAASAGASATAAARYSTAYCSIPIVDEPPWGFHAGAPISGASGSYARGHGLIDLGARTVSGIVCQVQRFRNGPDREIVLSVGRRLLYSSHTAVMWGVPGNVMRIAVRVARSTDPACAPGATGTMTIFASYNGVHRDSVQFSFPAACRTHSRLYTGLDVVTNVPPE